MTQPEFIAKFKNELLGSLCWGVFSDGHHHPLARQMTGQQIESNVDFTRDFLKRVWETLRDDPPPPKPPVTPLPPPVAPNPPGKLPPPPVGPQAQPQGTKR